MTTGIDTFEAGPKGDDVGLSVRPSFWPKARYFNTNWPDYHSMDVHGPRVIFIRFW